MRFRLNALLSLLLIVLAVMVIWVRTATVNETYRYVRLESRLRDAERALQETRVQWLRETSPRRLEALASSLGLAPPKLSQVLRHDSK